MNELLMTEYKYLGFRQYWDVENFTSAFLKCTKWQEELTDSGPCRFRYFCDSSYPGNLPSWVDLVVCLLTATCYLLALFYTLNHDNNGSSAAAEDGGIDTTRQLRRRCLMPSGPILLPIVLLVLSTGFRINTTFPLSRMGPALLQIVQVSALAFDIPVERSIRYALLEASTASGILHASLYLDTIVLPYYTGLDALMRSTFSNDCDSCICRREALEVGGKLVAYRGWSVTAFFVLTTLCARLACGLFLEDRLSRFMKYLMEGLGWVMLSRDCVYLMVGFPHAEFPERAAHAAICFIISMHISKKVYGLLGFLEVFYGKQRRKDLVQIP